MLAAAFDSGVFAGAGSGASIRRLREENQQLRQQLEELQANYTAALVSINNLNDLATSWENNYLAEVERHRKLKATRLLVRSNGDPYSYINIVGAEFVGETSDLVEYINNGPATVPSGTGLVTFNQIGWQHLGVATGRAPSDYVVRRRHNLGYVSPSVPGRPFIYHVDYTDHENTRTSLQFIWLPEELLPAVSAGGLYPGLG